MLKNFLISMLLAAVLSACNSEDEGCGVTSVGVVSFWLEKQDSTQLTSEITGEFLGSGLPNAMNQQRYEFRDSTGTSHILVAATPGVTILLDVGETYHLQIDVNPGMPTTSGLLIWDAREELVFAGLADFRPRRSVLKDGLFGITAERVLLDSFLEQTDTCIASEQKAKIRFERGTNSVVLCPGDVDTLGVYEVHCLTAREVSYTDTCSDAGLIEVSYMLISQ